MYLYKCVIVAKPNSFSTDHEARHIQYDFTHAEQLTHWRCKEIVMNEAKELINSLTCILSFNYTFHYKPELAIE